MEILDIKSLNTDDDGIYYRRTYTGIASIKLVAETIEVSLSFTIETDALGRKMLDVDLDTSKINYPVVPLMSKLKAFITAMDQQGRLL